MTNTEARAWRDVDDKRPRVLSALTIDESTKRCGLPKNKTYLTNRDDVNQNKKFWNDFNKIIEVVHEMIKNTWDYPSPVYINNKIVKHLGDSLQQQDNE